jgi:hypothetical protein
VFRTKAFILMVLIGLLSIGILGSIRCSYAQDADPGQDSDGSWSAPQTGATDDYTKKPNPTMHIAGCWSGTATDAGDGTGTARFEFHQNGNLKKLVIGTTFDFQWSDSAFAHGPLKGSVTTNGFAIKGNAGRTCPVTGTGTGDSTQLTGTLVFTGNCADIFQTVTFSIAPGC